MFLKEVSYASQGWIYFIKKKYSNILKHYYTLEDLKLKFYLFLWCKAD